MTLSSLPPQLSTPPAEVPSSLHFAELETLPSETSDPCQGDHNNRRQSWAVFASTFFTIFLAEIGDKTQLTTLLMAAQSHAPWVVFAGAGSALVLTSLLGVLLGRWLACRIAPKTLETSAGVTLLLIAATLVWDVLR